MCVHFFCDGEEATIECTVTGRRKYSADLAQGGLLSSFQDNAYGTRRFRKPVAWPKVVSDRHSTELGTKSQV